jgi:hypothetical protein
MKGRRQLGRLETVTYCKRCDDFTIATPEGESLNRCTSCGSYATDDPDVCCTVHEVRSSPYPSGECPYCEMERDRQAQIEHEMTRDPRVEPW